MVRSIVSVVAGLASAGLVVAGATWVSVLLFFGGDFTAPPTGVAYIGLNLAYTTAAGAIGGWVAGVIASRRPEVHAIALAAIILALGLGGGRPDESSGVPWWYGYAVAVLGAAGALLGGWLCQLSRTPGGSRSAE